MLVPLAVDVSLGEYRAVEGLAFHCVAWPGAQLEDALSVRL